MNKCRSTVVQKDVENNRTSFANVTVFIISRCVKVQDNRRQQSIAVGTQKKCKGVQSRLVSKNALPQKQAPTYVQLMAQICTRDILVCTSERSVAERNWAGIPQFENQKKKEERRVPPPQRRTVVLHSATTTYSTLHKWEGQERFGLAVWRKLIFLRKKNWCDVATLFIVCLSDKSNFPEISSKRQLNANAKHDESD